MKTKTTLLKYLLLPSIFLAITGCNNGSGSYPPPVDTNVSEFSFENMEGYNYIVNMKDLDTNTTNEFKFCKNEAIVYDETYNATIDGSWILDNDIVRSDFGKKNVNLYTINKKLEVGLPYNVEVDNEPMKVEKVISINRTYGDCVGDFSILKNDQNINTDDFKNNGFLLSFEDVTNSLNFDIVTCEFSGNTRDALVNKDIGQWKITNNTTINKELTIKTLLNTFVFKTVGGNFTINKDFEYKTSTYYTGKKAILNGAVRMNKSCEEMKNKYQF